MRAELERPGDNVNGMRRTLAVAALLVVTLTGCDKATSASPTTSTVAPAPSTSIPNSPTTTTLPADPVAAGMVALCRDGGYSNNTTFRATCSGGNGIDHWLAPYGQCHDGTVIRMDATSSCVGHDDFAGLLPVDYTPPTSAPPTTAAPTTITTAAPLETSPPPTVAPSPGGFRCVDGTMSYAAHRQGACSFHGGIA